ncbi:MAG: NAD-dependent epimerase/dehydratase family protein [Thiobacillaceae bacterium]|jgi:nucleoside-diphosphate-sugar epimerase
MHTILGAGGAIGTELLKELALLQQPARLVGRNPAPVDGATEAVPADISRLDQTVQAVSGSTVVYLLVGLKYDVRVWQELWPRIMHNAIEACKRANAKLIFFDNVYMYGKVSGRMTEETPFNPCSRKGEVRAQIASALLDEIKSGQLNAMIARSADFYGPHAGTSVANILVFDKFAKGDKAAWLVNDSLPHSYTFTPDAARSLVMLANAESAWNETWHVPTASNPPTGKEFIQMVAREFGVTPRYRVLSRPMIRVAGLFNSGIRESYEMLYQSDSEYIFDSSKFSKAFGLEPTSYVEGVRRTAAAYRPAVG